MALYTVIANHLDTPSLALPHADVTDRLAVWLHRFTARILSLPFVALHTAAAWMQNGATVPSPAFSRVMAIVGLPSAWGTPCIVAPGVASMRASMLSI